MTDVLTEGDHWTTRVGIEVWINAQGWLINMDPGFGMTEVDEEKIWYYPAGPGIKNLIREDLENYCAVLLASKISGRRIKWDESYARLD